jgi:hypothetical protein
MFQHIGATFIPPSDTDHWMAFYVIGGGGDAFITYIIFHDESTDL